MLPRTIATEAINRHELCTMTRQQTFPKLRNMGIRAIGRYASFDPYGAEWQLEEYLYKHVSFHAQRYHAIVMQQKQDARSTIHATIWYYNT